MSPDGAAPEPGPTPGARGELERALEALATVRYTFTLFVTGASPLSARAITNARAICEAHLPGRYDLTVVDVRSGEWAGSASGVLAVPTFVRDLPLPRRVVVGDLSDPARVLQALDLPTLDLPAADVPARAGSPRPP